MGERIKDQSCFEKPAEDVAKWLLGKTICIKQPDGLRKMRIMEVEAYSSDDTACYGYDNYKKKTDPTKAKKPLFDKPGTCCIYAGMILISCTKQGAPDNVLIRKAGNCEKYCEGPVLTGNELGVDRIPNDEDILTSDYIWLENSETENKFFNYKRVNLSKNVEDSDRNKPLRFVSI